MKLISFCFLFFALFFCNLADRFIGQKTGSGSDNSNSTKTSESSSSQPNSSGDGIGEKYTLTPEQTNILNSGKEIKWDEQGMSWKLPVSWKKLSSTPNTLQWSSADGVFLIVSISPMGADFPVDASLKAQYHGSVNRQKNGELEKVRYLDLDGNKGVEFIESMPFKKDDPRRHQWIGFRKYAVQSQMVNIMLSTKGINFDKQRDILTAIMSSSQMVK